tara:strand:- start:59 stop:253 length:195 start_codon:yes stop_codon:yes gene_type:complete
MSMTIKEWKEADVKGYDVFLETGVRIKGFKCINDKARNEAIRKFIEILKADAVDFDYHEYKMED